jgi:GNAT superfamily N-acetyltransferase
MNTPPDLTVRRADLADAEAIGQLLHDFNSEFDEPTPSPPELAERVRQLLAEGQIVVLVAGTGPDGLAVLRFRPAIWTNALECYVAELYVVAHRRGHGLGRALMQAAIELARREGADHMDLGTSDETSPPAPCMRASGSATAVAGQTARSATSTSGSYEGARSRLAALR